MSSVCIFGASSGSMRREYYEAAHAFGEMAASSGRELLFGGGDRGVMGACARGAKGAGGRVVGVIPEALHQPGIAYPHCDELIVTRDLRERMAVLEARSDAFVALPGGFGTLYELAEALTLSQLGRMDKCVLLLDTLGFYQPLAAVFERYYEENCAREICRALYALVETPEAAMDAIRAWTPPDRTAWRAGVLEGELK